jgi:hypothetical protein
MMVWNQTGGYMTLAGPNDVCEAADALVRYVPTHVDRSVWCAIRSTVVGAVAATTTRSSTAARYRSHVAAFSAWAHGQGVAAQMGAVFDPDLIERYIQTGMVGAKDSTRATRRAILRRVARHASPDLRHLPAPEPMRYRRVRPPYSGAETGAFLRLAAAQPTPGRRQSVQAVLGLGLGCGLDGRDMSWVRGPDVSVASDGSTVVSVTGGSRPRTVVALAEHEQALQQLARAARERLLIGGSTLGRHNVTSAALERLISDPALPRLVAARLRSTWLLHHLRLGTPLPILMPAAGLTTVRPLEDLLADLDPPTAETAARWLRGAG